MRLICLTGTASIFAATMPAHATFTTYTNKAAWQAAAGSYSTITFQELPVGTNIVDSYADLGVHFTDGIDLIYANDSFADSVGVNGAFDSSTLVFDSDVYSVALDAPGFVQFKLYNDGVLIYTSPVFVGSNPIFGGIVANQPFDKVQMFDPTGGFFADNLYFGPPVPGPGALALLSVGALGGLMGRSRRRG